MAGKPTRTTQLASAVISSGRSDGHGTTRLRAVFHHYWRSFPVWEQTVSPVSNRSSLASLRQLGLNTLRAILEYSPVYNTL